MNIRKGKDYVNVYAMSVFFLSVFYGTQHGLV